MRRSTSYRHGQFRSGASITPQWFSRPRNTGFRLGYGSTHQVHRRLDTPQSSYWSIAAVEVSHTHPRIPIHPVYSGTSMHDSLQSSSLNLPRPAEEFWRTPLLYLHLEKVTSAERYVVAEGCWGNAVGWRSIRIDAASRSTTTSAHRTVRYRT